MNRIDMCLAKVFWPDKETSLPDLIKLSEWGHVGWGPSPDRWRDAVQIKSQDEQLAKAKRMMVALNNKFKAKFAKQAEEAKAAASATDSGASAALQQEVDDHKTKLGACEKRIADLEQALDASQTACDEARQNLQGVDDKDAEIAELRQAVAERDAIIDTAKEKYQAMGQKARAAVEERNAEIEALTEKLEEVCELECFVDLFRYGGIETRTVFIQ